MAEDKELQKQEEALKEAMRTPENRAKAAAKMMVRGASMQEIADRLGFASPHAVKMAVESVLAASLTIPEREALRSIAHRRYEELLKSVMPRATNPKDTQHLPYNARANAILDRWTKLHGLDEPTKIQVTTPTAEELSSFTRQIKEHLGLNPDIVEEADILDIEDAQIVEEDDA